MMPAYTLDKKKENNRSDPEEKGGITMLVEGIVLGVAMLMYVGADWTMEEVEREDQ